MRPDDPHVLVDALIEQGLSNDEASETAQQLRLWTVPEPNPALAAKLVDHLHARATARTRRPDLHTLLSMARLQVRILRPAFWLSSAVVTALGGLLLMLRPDAQHTLLLYLVGPLVGYLAVATAFQGADLGLLECELACPPSPRQLVVARLTVVLGYTLGLGLLLTLAAGWQSASQLSLSWLAPLLVEVGLTLLLSVRAGVERAAAVVYAVWATLLLGLTWGVAAPPPRPTLPVDLLLCAPGLGLLGLAVYVAPQLLGCRLGMRSFVA